MTDPTRSHAATVICSVFPTWEACDDCAECGFCIAGREAGVGHDQAQKERAAALMSQESAS